MTSLTLTPEDPVRELDHRTNDGIDVRLLWNSHTGRVSLEVVDARSDASFELEVEPARALDAFHHPYAYIYANRDHTDHALAA